MEDAAAWPPRRRCHHRQPSHPFGPPLCPFMTCQCQQCGGCSSTSTTSSLSNPHPSLLLSMTCHSPSFLFTPHPTSSSHNTTMMMTMTTWRTWQHGHHVIIDPLPVTAPLVNDLPFAIPLFAPHPTSSSHDTITMMTT